MRKEIYSAIILVSAFLAGCSFVYVKSQVDITNEAVKEIIIEPPVPVVVPVPDPVPPKVDEAQEKEPEPKPNLEATAKNYEEWFDAVDMGHPDKSISRHIYEQIKKDPFFSGMTIISVARSGSSVVITARNSMQISEDIRWTYLCDFSDIQRNVVCPIGTTMTYIGERN